MDNLKRNFLDECGTSLIEVLAAIVILGVALIGLAAFIQVNFIAIDMNTEKEEAIFIREDIKEWLSFRAQSQDIANLNQISLVIDKENGTMLDEGQLMRRMHFILDESGIQKSENGEFIYGEILRDSTTDRGDVISKVRYDFSGDQLPSNLNQDEYNRYYIAEYLDSSGKPTDFLVEVLVEFKSVAKDYNPRTDGVGLNILIYSKKNGTLLTESYINWVAEY